jgi:hypothetical protein
VLLPLPVLAAISRAARGRGYGVACASGAIPGRGWAAAAAVIAALMASSVLLGLVIEQRLLRF